jgi:hypothetical protein
VTTTSIDHNVPNARSQTTYFSPARRARVGTAVGEQTDVVDTTSVVTQVSATIVEKAKLSTQVVYSEATPVEMVLSLVTRVV